MILCFILSISAINSKEIVGGTPISYVQMDYYLQTVNMTLEEIISSSTNIIIVQDFDLFETGGKWVEGPVAWYYMVGRRCHQIVYK